jgi:hypothetical protein
MAGGEKYSCQGLFFKLVRDNSSIYDSYELASKVAAHEIKGLSAYQTCGVSALTTTLMSGFALFHLRSLSFPLVV